MRKFIYDKQDVVIAMGALAYSRALDLTRGTCVGVKFINFELPAAIRDHAVDLNINTSGGDKILGATDYRDFIHPGGSYLEGGFKPCNFKTDSQIRVDVLASEAIKGADFKGQVVFCIIDENQSI